MQSSESTLVQPNGNFIYLKNTSSQMTEIKKENNLKITVLQLDWFETELV